jgi:SAM-dependent methyltransferase
MAFSCTKGHVYMGDTSTDASYRPVSGGNGRVTVEPLPSRDYLAKYYADNYYQRPDSQSYAVTYSPLELAHRRLRSSAMVYAIEQCCTPRTMLDCGTGEGFLLAAAVESGLDAVGIDYSTFGVETWHPHLAGRLIAGDIEQTLDSFASDGRTFDACTLVNVLEHVRSPLETLQGIAAVLSKEAVIAITVPNDYSTLQQLLTDEGLISEPYWFSPPQHLSYWNTDSLPRFLDGAGLSVLDAFSDFPIELYLLHPGSSYTADRANNGPAAHTARLQFDLLIAEKGLDAYLDFYRSLFRVGQGRNITVLARPVT